MGMAHIKTYDIATLMETRNNGESTSYPRGGNREASESQVVGPMLQCKRREVFELGYNRRPLPDEGKALVRKLLLIAAVMAKSVQAFRSLVPSKPVRIESR